VQVSRILKKGHILLSNLNTVGMCACLIFLMFLWCHLQTLWSVSNIEFKEAIIHIEFEGTIIP